MSQLPASAAMKSGASSQPRWKLSGSRGVKLRCPVGQRIFTAFMAWMLGRRSIKESNLIDTACRLRIEELEPRALGDQLLYQRRDNAHRWRETRRRRGEQVLEARQRRVRGQHAQGAFGDLTRRSGGSGERDAHAFRRQANSRDEARAGVMLPRRGAAAAKPSLGDGAQLAARSVADDRTRCERRGVDGPRRQRERRRGEPGELDASDALGGELLSGWQIGRKNRHVELAGKQPLAHALARIDAELERDAGIGLCEAANQRGEPRRRRHARHAEPHAAGERILRADALAALRRDARVAPRAVEELYTKAALQAVDPRRDRRLRRLQVTCRGLEAAESRHPIQRLELLEVHLHKITPAVSRLLIAAAL